MKKKIQQKNLLFSVMFVSLSFFVIQNFLFQRDVFKGVLISIAHAEREDDDNERENEEDDDNYSSSSSSSSDTTSSTTKSTPTYKTVYVTKIITTLDPIFTIDTDKDGIVNGLDPHPTIPEKEFFTDDDNDGVPNAFDKHPEEDDYAYFEQDNDTNKNGILDSFESLGSN